MDQKSKIGAFFKEQLGHCEDDVSSVEFEMMQARMSKFNFMRFSAQHFNVYYAAAIVSGLLLSSILGVHYLSVHKKESQKIENLQKQIALLTSKLKDLNLKDNDLANKGILNDNIPKSNSSTLSDPSYNQLAKRKLTDLSKSVRDLKSANGISSKDNTGLDLELNGDASEIKKEPVKNVENIVIETDSLPEKKTIVIYKRDTIVQYDTVKIKGKRK